jgi:hypothetical protein
MHNLHGVHVQERKCCISHNPDPLGHRELNDLLLHVKHVEKRSIDVLEDNNDVRNRRHHTHDKSNIGVSKDTLHDDFILNFSE